MIPEQLNHSLEKNHKDLIKKERIIVLLLAAVQFVNILDFMMVMPLGPDFADDLKIPTSQLGIIAGAYTFAAAFSGCFLHVL